MTHKGAAGPLLLPAQISNTSLPEIIVRLEASANALDELARHSHHQEVERYARRQRIDRIQFMHELSAGRTISINPRVPVSLGTALRRTVIRLFGLLPKAQIRRLKIIESNDSSLRAAYFQALQQSTGSPALTELFQRQQVHVSRAQAELRTLLARIALF